MKTIVITGAVGGLGFELVKQLYACGDRIFALDRNITSAMEQLLADAQNDHLLFFSECDVTSTASVETAAAKIKENVDHIDVFYSCAGILRWADKVPITETDLDAITSVVDVNAVGFLRAIKALHPLFDQNSLIMCVTSEAGSIADNHRTTEYSYCMSKAAENMACAILRKHFHDTGIGTRVLCLHPGWLKTPMGGVDIAEMEPSDSARDLIGIMNDIDSIPEDLHYIDNKRRPLRW